MTTWHLEEWRGVIGHEGSYEVSSHGNVRSLDRDVWMAPTDTRRGHWSQRKGRRLRPGEMAGPGSHVTVSIGKGNSRCVHVLVAEAFLGPRPEGNDVCHIDGRPGNNSSVNLYYGSRSDNNRDIARHGRRLLSPAQVEAARERRARGASVAEMAREYGTCLRNMRYILRGEYYASI